ncbi:hypothetical protein [Legionella gresilensis]|uniref:hypothetical protein n=1 Tax=Legionella gresilensis TaxID=91823 RepID=UPI001041228C|nr:hypothetical protein [Legionella gresilensis]
MANTAKILAALNKDDVIAEVNQIPSVEDVKKSLPRSSSSQNMAKIVEGIGKSLAEKDDFDLTPGS